MKKLRIFTRKLSHVSLKFRMANNLFSSQIYPDVGFYALNKCLFVKRNVYARCSLLNLVN